MAVTLINPFEVAPDSEDRFLESWQRAAAYMERQSGFISTRLHRALAPNARFQFVNIAEWESPQHFMAAVQSQEFQELAAGAPPNFPALYQVVTAQPEGR
jgi:heme-degrading monooxygenase HmoA